MIANGLVSASGLDLVVSPAGSSLAVLTLAIFNYSGLDSTVQIFVVPSGGTVGDQSQIAERLLRTKETFAFSSEKILLSEGDKIVVKASADSQLSAMASYADAS